MIGNVALFLWPPTIQFFYAMSISIDEKIIRSQSDFLYGDRIVEIAFLLLIPIGEEMEAFIRGTKQHPVRIPLILKKRAVYEQIDMTKHRWINGWKISAREYDGS